METFCILAPVLHMLYICRSRGGYMRKARFAVLWTLFALSCSGGKNYIKDVDAVSDISSFKSPGIESVSADNADSILTRYSVDFTIPNPLFGESSGAFRRQDPQHQSTINCRAVLLDERSTKADILARCKRDSLDEQACEAFRKEYYDEHVQEGMFRIRITMESGFSRKSMEPELWALYLENARGILIEPSEIRTSGITAVGDSVSTNYSRMYNQQRLLQRDITCYFKQVTFFGEDLLGKDNPYFVFVVSREKKTLARVAWNLTGDRKAFNVQNKQEQ